MSQQIVPAGAGGALAVQKGGRALAETESHDYVSIVIAGQLFGIRQNLKRAKCAARRSIDDRGSFAVPASTVQARAQSFVCRIPRTPEPVNNHLPYAVFDLAESVLHSGYAFRSVQERDRCLVA